MDDDLGSTPLLRCGEESKRQKVIKTLWIFWAIMLVGFTNGILGPTVLPLLQLTNTSMSRINWIFTGQGLGFACGVVFASLLSKRLSPYLSLSAAILLASAVNSFLPWMRSFPAMAAAVLGQFFMKGMVYYGSMFLCGLIWPRDNDVPFQFIVTGLGLGAFISPFFVYLAVRGESNLAANQSQSSGEVEDFCQQYTSGIHENITLSLHFIQGHCSHLVKNIDYIYIPYLLVALLVLPPGVAFAYYFIRDRGIPKSVNQETYESLSEVTIENKNGRKVSKLVYCIVMCLLLIFYIPFGGILISFSHLLSAFGMKCKLHLTASSMAMMTSLYWGCCLLGRTINTLLTARFDLFLIIVSNFVGLFAASLALLFMAEDYEVALWLGTAALSLFNSMFLPAVMTWVGTYVALDGFAICLSLVGLATGELVWPIFGGYAFNTFGPMTLMYLTFGLVCLQFSIFMSLKCIIVIKLRKGP